MRDTKQREQILQRLKTLDANSTEVDRRVQRQATSREQ